MRRAALAIVPFSLAFAATSAALPPGESRGFRDGANHHLGDDSFVAQTGRAPGRADDEKLRMHTHLGYVRALLASRPATATDRAARRTELLGYLDDYIARGITPRNEALPWRSPVFIDDDGNICAVGYLIERSVGRGVAERIARRHRYDFLEDIAAAMPEVRAWVAASGFTLEELASIQPGYEQPAVEDWVRWNVEVLPPPDGAYRDKITTGAWRGRRMEGAWTRTSGDVVVGRGALHRGNGTWTSFYPDGSKMAEGPIVRNDPHGAWTLFHPSGNVAAEGRFDHGMRDGTWRFYYDTRGRTPIAVGSFAGGALVGTWRHFDAAGKLLARSSTIGRGEGFGEYLLHIVPGDDGVIHEVDQFGGPDRNRLDSFVRGRERIYVLQRSGDGDATYDAAGNELTQVDGRWFAAPCRWSAGMRRAARAADIATLHGLIGRRADACGEPVAVPVARSRRIDELLAQQTAVRSATPDFVRRLALGQPLVAAADTADAGDGEGEGEDDGADDAGADYRSSRVGPDLPQVLAANMVWYIEWPHIDRRFIRLFKTIPGYWPGRPNGDPRPEAERDEIERLEDYAGA